MHGIGITEYGQIDQLKSIYLPTGYVGANDLLISIQASGVNFFDCKVRSGVLRGAIPLPTILGWDASGIVKKVGSNVKRFAVNDKVYFRPPTGSHGTYADEIVVSEDAVAPMPVNLEFFEAASFPLVGLTVWQALVEAGYIAPGMNVLILAGSGGIGSFAIQLAKAFGAYVCTTTSTNNAEFVRSLGADEVMTYDNNYMYTNNKYDLMLDTLGGDAYAHALSFMKKDAMVTTLIKERDVKPSSLKAELEAAMNIQVKPINTREDGENLRQIKQLIETGQIKPVISRVFPMTVEGTRQAHEIIESRRTVGKIVLSRT